MFTRSLICLSASRIVRQHCQPRVCKATFCISTSSRFIMPGAQQAAIAANKRKASRKKEDQIQGDSAKKARNGSPSSESSSAAAKNSTNSTSITSTSSDPLRTPHYNFQATEDSGVVLREFYPSEMNNDRCAAYNSNELPRPTKLLEDALKETSEKRARIPVKDSVVHWYKCDLRIGDNNSLHLASQMAKTAGAALICMYIISPQDFEAHLTSPARVDFVLRTLEILKKDLAGLDIPLYVETVEIRKEVPDRIMQLLDAWGSSHLFTNVEYEVDELRREAKMVRGCLERDIAMEVVPDTCIVSPGELSSGTGKQYSVYSPWYKAWIQFIHNNMHLLALSPRPEKNPSSAREKFKVLFEQPIPVAPPNKSLTDEEKAYLRPLWPAGEHEAHRRLEKFAEEKIVDYCDNRNFPAIEGTSCLSVHFSSGTLSARTAIKTARDYNKTKRLDGGSEGIQSWISEVAWRDFYKHVLAQWPFVCMNKPFKPEYSNIEWSYDTDLLEAWKKGMTGFPIVDACMRQLASMSWMHNRSRMIAASFLAKDLLIDWRLGEQHYMLNLIDGDFASNNGGWGFSASTGVDPQPYFRIFNPLLQSERYDKEGEYIRKWVPELRGIGGKAIHDPYGRGAAKEAEEAGYPRPCVFHKDTRDKALATYKAGLGRATT